MVALVGLALLAACSAAPEAPDALVLSPEPEECGLAFDVPSELRAEGELAAARWSAATGCDVRVERGGLRIVMLDVILEEDGTAAIDSTGRPVRARTKTVWIDGELHTSRIEYRRDAVYDAGRILPHEFGHALGGYGHTETGVLRVSPKSGDPIDAPSLSLVCERLGCMWMRPEPWH